MSPERHILSSEPTSGIPYHRHFPDLIVASPSSTAAANPSTAQLPSNMLGARARAAEYNAARAATARQQANKESDGLNRPPKPAPVSLSAFTKNASYSRNRGAKNFVPLILSEEEDQSTTSVETESELNQVDPPPAEPVTRAASLPPPQTVPATKIEMEASVQTPFRYKSPQAQTRVYPHLARAFHSDDTYGFPAMGMAFYPQQHMALPQIQPLLARHSLMQTPHFGWHTPDHLATSNSYGSSDPSLVAQFSEQRPHSHRHNLSLDSVVVTEPAKESSSEPTFDSTHSATPLTSIGGPTLHVFGPDDLSPTKMEIKQRAREKYFAIHGPVLPTPATNITLERVSTPESSQVEYGKLITQSGHRLYHDGAKQPSGIRGLLIDHDSVAPVRARGSTMDTTPFPKFDMSVKYCTAEYGTPESLQRLVAGWNQLSQQRDGRQGIMASHGSPTTRTREAEFDIPMARSCDMFRDMAKIEAEAESYAVSKPRSWTQVDKSQAGPLDEAFERDTAKPMTSLNFPLEDITAPEWFEFRGLTARDREKISEVRKAMSSNSNLIQDQSNFSKIRRTYLQGHFQQRAREYERRARSVQELADEMQHRWEHGGESGDPVMTKQETESQVGKIREIGHMMIMLSIQADSSDELHDLGSRPYVQPPEYAIERSVGLNKETRTSLFEQEGDEVQSAPPRLARDPRFRSQLTDGMKIRGDDERIPRMFVARSRVHG